MTSELTVNVFLHKMLGPSYERRGRTTVRTLADLDVATSSNRPGSLHRTCVRAVWRKNHSPPRQRFRINAALRSPSSSKYVIVGRITISSGWDVAALYCFFAKDAREPSVLNARTRLGRGRDYQGSSFFCQESDFEILWMLKYWDHQGFCRSWPMFFPIITEVLPILAEVFRCSTISAWTKVLNIDGGFCCKVWKYVGNITR